MSSLQNSIALGHIRVKRRAGQVTPPGPGPKPEVHDVYPDDNDAPVNEVSIG